MVQWEIQTHRVTNALDNRKDYNFAMICLPQYAQNLSHHNYKTKIIQINGLNACAWNAVTFNIFCNFTNIISHNFCIEHDLMFWLSKELVDG